MDHDLLPGRFNCPGDGLWLAAMDVCTYKKKTKDVELLQPKVFHKREKHSRKLYLDVFNSVLLPWPFPSFFFTAPRPSYSEWLEHVTHLFFPSGFVVQTMQGFFFLNMLASFSRIQHWIFTYTNIHISFPFREQHGYYPIFINNCYAMSVVRLYYYDLLYLSIFCETLSW